MNTIDGIIFLSKINCRNQTINQSMNKSIDRSIIIYHCEMCEEVIACFGLHALINSNPYNYNV